jgi:hypothetical protein
MALGFFLVIWIKNKGVKHGKFVNLILRNIMSCPEGTDYRKKSIMKISHTHLQL